MSQAELPFASLRDPETTEAMKRAFDETSAAIRAWGALGAIFEEDEAEAAIAEEIVALAEEGVTDADTLVSRALTRIGAEALDRVARNIRPRSRDSGEDMFH